jgi:glycosyltransferase involved in cell wall biosynthesis
VAATILHLTTFLQGGAGRAVVDLALAQQADGLRPVVVASATGKDGYGNYPEYLAALGHAGVSLYLLDSLFTRDLACNLSVVAALQRTLPVGDVTLVHAHAATPARIGLLLADGAPHPLPVVQTMHGWGIGKSPDQAAADIAVLARVDAVVTTSEASSRQLASLGLSAQRIQVIPCGLPAAAPAPRADEVSRALRRARSDGDTVLLCIGSVTANKNQRLLLEALPAALRERSLFCGFIGEGPGIDALSRRAQELGIESRVRFFGQRPSAASYLVEADLLVVPSQSEGQGLVVLEAFRAGVPVAVSDAPALRELVSEPDLGVTFASGSKESLAAAMGRALAWPASERAAIIERARTRFASRFTTGVMHQSHAALYRAVLARRCPAMAGDR